MEHGITAVRQSVSEHAPRITTMTVPRDKIPVFADKGWAVLEGAELRLTPSGRLLADAITAALSP